MNHTPYALGKNFITELHHKVVTRQLISIKQKQLALKISMKAYKSKKKNARSNV